MEGAFLDESSSRLHDWNCASNVNFTHSSDRSAIVYPFYFCLHQGRALVVTALLLFLIRRRQLSNLMSAHHDGDSSSFNPPNPPDLSQHNPATLNLSRPAMPHVQMPTSPNGQQLWPSVMVGVQVFGRWFHFLLCARFLAPGRIAYCGLLQDIDRELRRLAAPPLDIQMFRGAFLYAGWHWRDPRQSYATDIDHFNVNMTLCALVRESSRSGLILTTDITVDTIAYHESMPSLRPISLRVPWGEAGMESITHFRILEEQRHGLEMVNGHERPDTSPPSSAISTSDEAKSDEGEQVEYTARPHGTTSVLLRQQLQECPYTCPAIEYR